MNMHKAIVDPEPVTVPVSLRDFRRLQWIKTSARFSIGLVWVWEGLIPKILHPSATQFEMVRRSGWWWGSPEQTLYWLGMAMILAGFGIMSGIWERAAALISTLAVLVLMVLVITSHPEALHDPFGGLVKDACLFNCAALVWWWPRLPASTKER
ncbi:DoxX-like family protein [Verrucomicrobium spinosum]|uniref:DoxX-like family protein n=1 Tax=Verrucomicrobium spinosum TaxID=2736 RepID=UPI0001746449|nr:DoxX-like family protein [Verrucomicrobium spinosum]